MKSLFGYSPLFLFIIISSVQAQTECVAPSDRIFAIGFESPVSDLLVAEQRNFASPYPSGFGKPFGSAFVWQTHSVKNSPPLVTVRAYKFVAPANASGRLAIGSNNGPQAWSISRQCRQWNLDDKCRGYYGGTTFSWSTEGGNGCQLEAGKTYYFQAAYFNLPLFVNTGAIESTCSSTCPFMISAFEN